MSRSKIEVQKMCAWCGKLFMAQKTTTSYCSHKCSSTAYKKRKREELVGEVSLASDATAAHISTQSFEEKEYLTVAEVARLWGLIGKQSITFSTTGNSEPSNSLRVSLLSGAAILILFSTSQKLIGHGTSTPGVK